MTGGSDEKRLTGRRARRRRRRQGFRVLGLSCAPGVCEGSGLLPNSAIPQHLQSRQPALKSAVTYVTLTTELQVATWRNGLPTTVTTTSSPRQLSPPILSFSSSNGLNSRKSRGSVLKPLGLHQHGRPGRPDGATAVTVSARHRGVTGRGASRRGGPPPRWWGS